MSEPSALRVLSLARVMGPGSCRAERTAASAALTNAVSSMIYADP